MQGYIRVCAARFHTPLAFLRPKFILRIGLNPFLQGPLPHYPITLLPHYPITPLPSLSKVPHPMTFRHWRTWLLKAIQGQVNLLFTLKKYLDGGRGWILPSVQEREEKKFLILEEKKASTLWWWVLSGSLWKRESGPNQWKDNWTHYT